MSGQVEQAPQQLIVNTICPIVKAIDPLIEYKTALTFSVKSPVNAGFNGCSPTAETIAYVFTEAQIPKCCGVQPVIKQVSPSYA
jgi:Na+-translocating ferredoxin:NAD+ oxidoreductase RNF subunit RnfB